MECADLSAHSKANACARTATHSRGVGLYPTKNLLF